MPLITTGKLKRIINAYTTLNAKNIKALYSEVENSARCRNVEVVRKVIERLNEKPKPCDICQIVRKLKVKYDMLCVLNKHPRLEAFISQYQEEVDFLEDELKRRSGCIRCSETKGMWHYGTAGKD